MEGIVYWCAPPEMVIQRLEQLKLAKGYSVHNQLDWADLLPPWLYQQLLLYTEKGGRTAAIVDLFQKFPRGVSKDFARCLTRSSKQWSLRHGRFQFAEEAWAQMGVPSMAAIAQEAGLSPHWANVLRDTSCSERSLFSVAGNSMMVVVVGVVYLNLLATFNP